MPYCGRRRGPPSTKLSLAADRAARMGPGDCEIAPGSPHFAPGDFVAERAKRIFCLSTSRRAVYGPAAADSRARGIGARGRNWPDAYERRL